MAKWMLYLRGYNFKVEYIKGSSNKVADCLSRLVDDEKVEENCKEMADKDTGAWNIVANISEEEGISEELWEKEADKDKDYVSLMEIIVKGWPERITQVDVSVRCYWEVRHELTMENKRILRKNKLVPPSALRERLIKIVHEGHLGRGMTKRKLRDVYWWPYMDSMVECVVRDCIPCANSDKTHGSILPSTSCTKVEVQKKVWSKIAVDIMGPVEGLGTTKYLIVFIDYYSKWPVIVEAREVTTKVILDAMNDVFSVEGCPEIIVTDNGVQFVSVEAENFFRKHNIKHWHTALYSPEQNGLVERFNKTIKGNLQLAHKSGLPWKTSLRKMLWEYRSTPTLATGESPFVLMRGRRYCDRSAPGWINRRGSEQRIVNEEEVADTQMVNCRIEKCKDAGENALKVGDWVRIQVPSYRRKLEQKWSDPVKVIKIINGVVEVEDGKRWSLRRVTKCYAKEVTSVYCVRKGEV